MRMLEIIVTGDGRVELCVDGAEPFLLGGHGPADVIGHLEQRLLIAARVLRAGGSCRLRLTEAERS